MCIYTCFTVTRFTVTGNTLLLSGSQEKPVLPTRGVPRGDAGRVGSDHLDCSRLLSLQVTETQLSLASESREFTGSCTLKALGVAWPEAPLDSGVQMMAWNRCDSLPSLSSASPYAGSILQQLCPGKAKVALTLPASASQQGVAFPTEPAGVPGKTVVDWITCQAGTSPAKGSQGTMETSGKGRCSVLQ